MTGWGMEPDLYMDRNPDDPTMLTFMLNVRDSGSFDANGNGFVDLKFRANNLWDINWGAEDFPSGTATQGGADILVPFGVYMVEFNCETGDYSFTENCGRISIIGELTGWAEDLAMESTDGENWTAFISTNLDDDISDPKDTIIEMKFRSEGMWNYNVGGTDIQTNWGASDFPAGTATLGGANIRTTPGNYRVDFNCTTGEYTFTEVACGQVSVIGEFVEWSNDVFLTRNETDPSLWSGFITVNSGHDTDEDGFVGLKFRQNADWAVNWGEDSWPSGTAVGNGPNIMIPVTELDEIGITYEVAFDCSTGEYSFTQTFGSIGLIGEFVGWAEDIDMQRDADDPSVFTISRSFFRDTEGKFRQNDDWGVNWGGTGFPMGDLVDNSPDNIPITAGKYDITFDGDAGTYSFVENPDICGEVGLIGDFNQFGADGTEDYPADALMVRDLDNPNNYSLEYNFASATTLLFREDADVTFNDVWGSTDFPIGSGLKGRPELLLNVPGGTYLIEFNCLSGDYSFTRLGSAVNAPQVFALSVDGSLDERDWNVDQPINSVVDGDPGDDPNEAFFGAAYTSDLLYVGIDVRDADVVSGDLVHIFFDGDKSGGDYTDGDIYFTVDVDGNVNVVAGNMSAAVEAAVSVGGEGYIVEASVSLSDLGADAMPGGGASIDIGITDVETGGPAATTMWNGNLGNLENASALGDMNYTDLACGDISLYNENIGDVFLGNPVDLPNNYIGTYFFESNEDVVFRKDGSSVVSWGSGDFPNGTATQGGSEIPVSEGRYRVSFNCLTGEYSFADDSDVPVAFAEFTDSDVTVDGDLSEYSLDYGMDVGPVDGSDPNNTVSWGALWDADNLYIGVQVVDGDVVGSAGNPWEHDGVEFYFDGNHNRHTGYEEQFDNQTIVDIENGSNIWDKGGNFKPFEEGAHEAVIVETANGYNVEYRLAWSHWNIIPGRNRSIGFTIGNNDRDADDPGRRVQEAWAGTGNNFDNTANFGDLQLAGGPLVDVLDLFFNENVKIFPNPVSNGQMINLVTTGDVFTGDTEIEIFNMMGQRVYRQEVNIDGDSNQTLRPSNLMAGSYFVHIIDEKGNRALKKLVIQ
jgi:hypothetical protein